MTIPAHHESALDVVAPLGAPAIVSAMLTLSAPMIAIDTVSEWIDDYGSMMCVALTLYIACALRLLCWGVSVRRTPLTVAATAADGQYSPEGAR